MPLNTWNSTASSTWSTPGNWSLLRAPITGDSIAFSSSIFPTAVPTLTIASIDTTGLNASGTTSSALTISPGGTININPPSGKAHNWAGNASQASTCNFSGAATCTSSIAGACNFSGASSLGSDNAIVEPGSTLNWRSSGTFSIVTASDVTIDVFSNLNFTDSFTFDDSTVINLKTSGVSLGMSGNGGFSPNGNNLIPTIISAASAGSLLSPPVQF